MAAKSIPVNELRQRLEQILSTLEATGEPYLITQSNRPKAVVLRYQDYEALVEHTSEGHPHITRRPEISGGEPAIRGTRISVRHTIERVQAGQSVDEILAALPHLTAAQVYDALAYYHDHKHEIDRLIEEAQPERVVARHGLKVEKVAEGVAVVHDAAGRW